MPLYVRALPPVSTVAQNDAEGHETEVRFSVLYGSTGANALHDMPLNVTASARTPTALQNEDDAHDTELSMSNV
jgi:hypothetical protein